MPPASKSYLRALVSKIHPQLPLDPRQSQQLLTILKTSFQKQLDLAHPPVGSPLPSSAVHGGHKLRVASSSPGRDITTSRVPTPQSSTVHHLESVLSNPLLATRPDPRIFIFGAGTSLEESKRRAGGTILSLSPQKAQQWFKEHVACGEANLNIAKIYLRTIHKSREDRHATNISASDDVLQWLLSSRLCDSAEFLSDFQLCSSLATSLVEEENYAGYSTLLLRVWSPIDSTARNEVPWKRVLVKKWFETNLKMNKAIGDLADSFLANVDAYRRTLASVDAIQTKLVFGKAGIYLAETLAGSGGMVSLGVYERFLVSVGQWSGSKGVADAILRLYHPTRPDATALCNFLKARYTVEGLKKTSASKRGHMVQMCLDAGNLLLSRGDHAGASWLLEFINSNFAEELRPNHENQVTIIGGHSDSEDHITSHKSQKHQSDQLQDMGIFAVG